jgi:alginate O-acetyltransferase complex protein AlgI
MLFNSPSFLFLFLPLFFVIYLLADKKYRRIIGLVGSVLFFSSFQLSYLPLIAGLIFWNYWFGLLLSKAGEEKIIQRNMWFGVGGNVLLLAGFKLLTTYGVAWVPDSIPPFLHPIFAYLRTLKFPLGLSYISFQAISYLVDVRRKRVDAEYNFVSLSLYIMLFPKILVGPISRYKTVAKTFPNPDPSPDDIANGIRRFIQGLAKKILIADTLALFVDAAFRIGPRSLTIELAWLTVLAYALQIYFDFSGYTDMALGLGRMMGFSLEENFNFPYISQSVGEFWRRWHISLSNWFRDYIFFPLERKRRRYKYYGQFINVVIVFLLTGLWHGITKTFVAWGLLHGLFIVLENAFLNRLLKKAVRPLRHTYLLFVVSMTWIVFRSPNLKFAWVFLLRLLGLETKYIPAPFSLSSPLPFIEPSFVLALFFGVILSFPVSSLFSVWKSKLEEKYPLAKMPLLVFFDVLLFVLLIASVAILANSSFNPSIYNNF